jgi:hypothetical protein
MNTLVSEEPAPSPSRAPNPDVLRRIGIPDVLRPACSFGLRVRWSVYLRFDERSAPFAELSGWTLTLRMAPAARIRGMVAEGQRDGVWVRGVAALDDLHFYPQRALLLGGILVPLARTRIKLRSARPGELTIAYRAEHPGEIRLLPEPNVEGQVECAGVGADPVRFDPMDAVGAEYAGAAMLRGGQTFALAAAPRSTPVTRLRTETEQNVQVLGERDGFTRIAVQRETDLLVGWVPSSALKPTEIGLGSIGTLGHGAGTGTGQGFGDFGSAWCPRDVPFDAEVGTRRVTVGVVFAERSIDLIESLDDRYSVGVRSTGLRPAEGARFTIKMTALAECRVRLVPGTGLRGEHRPQRWPPPVRPGSR